MKKLPAFLLCALLFINAKAMPQLPDASFDKLPRWRGFNLLEKFSSGNNRPFVEDDFKFIAEHGFNFVRLPLDYRCWIVENDWSKFNEKVLQEIDQAVEFGKKYNVHVSINFHRAPGYCVNPPKEPLDLWKNEEAQAVCAKHWAAFAKRYKGIPNTFLSFNLFNEPSNVDAETYLNVVRKMIDAIRAEDPNRLIISDGINWGGKPMFELIPLKLAQATRGYFPMQISHYKAGWVGGSDLYPVPVWPMSNSVGNFYGDGKREFQSPLTIVGPFTKPTNLRMHVAKVSFKAILVVEADGKEIFKHDFVPGPGEGEWKKVVLMPAYNSYQNIYDRDYTATIPAGTKELKIRVTVGDWLLISEIEVGGQKISLRDAYGTKQETLHYRENSSSNPASLMGDRMIDRKVLYEQMAPWLELQKQGGGVFVGEFGAHNQTPHDVALAWLEDNLANWKDANWGWAIWNLRGSFGIMDSGRKDVQYEDYNGRKLDRKMLELLKRY